MKKPDQCECGHSAATHLPGIGCYAGASGHKHCPCNGFVMAASKPGKAARLT